MSLIRWRLAVVDPHQYDGRIELLNLSNGVRSEMSREGGNADAVAVCSRRPDGQRNTASVANQMALTAAFSSIRRIWSSLLPPKNRTDRTTVNYGHVTSQSGSHVKASLAARSEQDPGHRPAANPADAASSSSPSRNLTLSGACERNAAAQHKNNPGEASAVG